MLRVLGEARRGSLGLGRLFAVAAQMPKIIKPLQQGGEAVHTSLRCSPKTHEQRRVKIKNPAAFLSCFGRGDFHLHFLPM